MCIVYTCACVRMCVCVRVRLEQYDCANNTMGTLFVLKFIKVTLFALAVMSIEYEIIFQLSIC